MTRWQSGRCKHMSGPGGRHERCVPARAAHPCGSRAYGQWAPGLPIEGLRQSGVWLAGVVTGSSASA